MRNRTILAVFTLAFASLGTLVTPSAFAEERDLGKHSQDEIKKACNAAGGDLLGVSDSGAYGCEVGSKGTMILCNKNQQCTGYTPARTHSDHNKILDSLKLKAKPTTLKADTK
jgi:hypothetical protein